MQIDVWYWSTATNGWALAGQILVPPGPSAQWTNVASSCGTILAPKVFQPTWGTPPAKQLYWVRADVFSGPCGSAGAVQSENNVRFVVTQ
jgi:hypothetical protein